MPSSLSGSDTVLILYKHKRNATFQLTYKFKFIHLNNTLFYTQYYLFYYLLEHLKGQCHEIFCFRFFFHESSFPKTLQITSGSFQICSNILGDIRKSRYSTLLHRYQRQRWQIFYWCLPHGWGTLSCEYPCKFSKLFETALMGLGETDS
jgi:hypothetical protein